MDSSDHVVAAANSLLKICTLAASVINENKPKYDAIASDLIVLRQLINVSPNLVIEYIGAPLNDTVGEITKRNLAYFQTPVFKQNIARYARSCIGEGDSEMAKKVGSIVDIMFTSLFEMINDMDSVKKDRMWLLLRELVNSTLLLIE
jgi:hypothetical protein